MSILFIGTVLNGPSQLWMRRQLKALGNRVTVLATTNDSTHAYINRYKVITLRKHDLPMLDTIFRRTTIVIIKRTIKSEKVSKILIHYLTDAVLYNAAFSDPLIPVFVHCHGYDVTWNLRDTSRKLVHGTNYVDKVRNLPEHIQFIANSKITKKRLVEIGLRQSRVHLKYMGVEVPKYFPERAGLTTKLNVLYLGRLVDFKGPDLVIRAFDIACQKGFDGKLVMAGSGPLSLTCELLRAHSPFRDRIQLLGEVDAATGKRLRSEADIFTAHNCTGPISGQEEAFGVSIVEAMAAGLPIVNADNGSIPEIVENNKQGILFSAGDIEVHANALLTLATNPERRHEMGRSGWERARDEFSIQSETARLREIMGESAD